MTRTSSLAPALVAAALAFVPALGAQTGPCNFGNARNTCITQQGTAVTDAAEIGDRFGAAIATGDFDDDGLRELVVGAPGENTNAGAIFVFERKGVGWKQKGGTILESSLPGQTAESGNLFGRALASADFDQDGYDDLAIGAPGKAFALASGANCGGDLICGDAGRVYVVRGGASGLDFTDLKILNANLGPGNAPLSDTTNYGIALAAGQIVGDAAGDLAVAAPGLTVDGEGQAGNVVLFRGDPVDLLVGQVMLESNAPQANERFGMALEVGQFGETDYRLAVGSPFTDVPGLTTDVDGGRVMITFHEQGGASDTLNASDCGATLRDGDRTGNAVAAGDFDDDGAIDLAFGAPLRDEGGIGVDDSGVVYVAYGGAQPLGSNDTDTFAQEDWGGDSQDSDALGAALQAGDLDGDGRDDLLVSAHREGSNDTGYLYLLWGTASGLAVVPSKGLLFSQAFLGGTNGDDDLFSYVLQIANVDLASATGGQREMIFGVPDKDLGAATDAGMVYVSRAFDGSWVFADGFEDTDTRQWSSTAD